MYAVLEYIETKEIDFLPIKWMVDRLNWDVKNLIKNKTVLNFYYPPVKSANKVLNAKKLCSNPEEHWLLYKVRILGTANTLKSAKEKTKQAEETSNVDYDTDDSIDYRDMETRKIRKRKYSFTYESDVDDDQVEDFIQESVLTGNTNSCVITKPTPPEHLRAIQSSSHMSQVKIKENVSISKYLNNAQSKPSESQSGVLQPDVLSSQLKIIVETPAHVLTSINSTVLLERLITTLEEIKENQKTHSVMLQSIMRQINTPQMEKDNELPIGIHLPISSIEDMNNLEEQLKDRSIKRTLTSIVSNIGGSSLDDAIKRMMKFILSNNLGRLCNLSGQAGKVCFSKLEIFEVVCGAVKRNALTANATQKEIEIELRKWFANARDRGQGNRKSKVSASDNTDLF
ncbi:uncharacterized protein LOC124815286 [Hydra vulgaris]|uniref:uncharacterized protein LOC124815286 n=1 Tax=Hydra vulgaris TaxID=6087 RepID=UPI001F5FD279|nr:uncharacterized protein LOC124815286 isoform X1 [Hydra vulgaris]